MNKPVVLALLVLALVASAFCGKRYPQFQNLKPSGKSGQPIGRCTIPWYGAWAQYLPDKRNCAAFYECDASGKPVHFDCPVGTCWNARVLTCDWPNSGGCAPPCSKY